MLPPKIRVKVLPEAAGYITVSQVVNRDFSMAELMEFLLPVVGTDAERIRLILRTGTVVTGDYRIRWESLEVEAQELEGLLAALPHAEPSRTFRPDAALMVRFRRGHETLDLSRESAARKALFARRSFWENLLSTFAEGVLYADYSHADKADVFAVELDDEGMTMLESLLSLVKAKGIAGRIQRLRPERIEWLVRR